MWVKLLTEHAQLAWVFACGGKHDRFRAYLTWRWLLSGRWGTLKHQPSRFDHQKNAEVIAFGCVQHITTSKNTLLQFLSLHIAHVLIVQIRRTIGKTKMEEVSTKMGMASLYIMVVYFSICSCSIQSLEAANCALSPSNMTSQWKDWTTKDHLLSPGKSHDIQWHSKTFGVKSHCRN